MTDWGEIVRNINEKKGYDFSELDDITLLKYDIVLTFNLSVFRGKIGNGDKDDGLEIRSNGEKLITDSIDDLIKITIIGLKCLNSIKFLREEISKRTYDFSDEFIDELQTDYLCTLVDKNEANELKEVLRKKRENNNNHENV